MTSAQAVIVALAAVAALLLVFRLVKTGSPADLSTHAGVALVSYSMFVPYLLLVFQMALKMATSIDVSKLEGTLKDMDRLVKAVQDEAEGRLSRAATMVSNSRDELGAIAGTLTARLASLIGSSLPPVDAELPPEVEPTPPAEIT